MNNKPLGAERFSSVILGLLLLCILTYHLPWLTASSAALSPGAADLAEWLSLHPAKDALTTAFWLRIPFAVLTIIIVLASPRSAYRWLHIALVICMWVALLPPLEFFTDAAVRSNPNFQQQFGLWVFGVLGASAGFTVPLRRHNRTLLLVFSAIVLMAAVWGIWQAYPLMAAFGYEFTLGFGAIGLVGTVLLLMIATGVNGTHKNKAASKNTLP